MPVDRIDQLRAREYALLAALLIRPPRRELLSRLAQIPEHDSALGQAHGALARAARRVAEADLEREYFDLFIGVGRGELLAYASYYLTGFLNEGPLARVRAALDALGIERSDQQPEPEDHIAILCEVMAGLAAGEFAADPHAQREFFEQHLKPWAGRFFTELEQAPAAAFYQAVGALGRAFMAIEAEAFAMD